MKIASFFSGAGGLDLGFERAGFDIAWANEYDKSIWATYEANFPKTVLNRKSIVDVAPGDIADDVIGMIGGPPCQSWSEAGARRGIEDKRGQLFFDYIRLLAAKRPAFFLAENVSGIVFSRHSEAFQSIVQSFAELGYNVSYQLLNANGYDVPQDRERVIIVGYLAQYKKFFHAPEPVFPGPDLKSAIGDLEGQEVLAKGKGYHNVDVVVRNHECLGGGFSSIYMSRNRVRHWDQPSFTIQAGGRHAPLHPSAPEMQRVSKDERAFVPGFDYRRLTVRECARVQTFPDDHEFIYARINDGYKMIGNAVPVNFAYALARQIAADLEACNLTPNYRRLIVKGEVRDLPKRLRPRVTKKTI